MNLTLDVDKSENVVKVYNDKNIDLFYLNLINISLKTF